jgi:hypothetical protein
MQPKRRNHSVTLRSIAIRITSVFSFHLHLRVAELVALNWVWARFLICFTGDVTGYFTVGEESRTNK